MQKGPNNLSDDALFRHTKDGEPPIPNVYSRVKRSHKCSLSVRAFMNEFPLLDWIKTGTIPVSQIRNALKIDRAELADWSEARRRKPLTLSWPILNAKTPTLVRAGVS